MLEQIISKLIDAIFIGLGSSIGSYFGGRLIVRHIEKLEKKLKGGRKR